MSHNNVCVSSIYVSGDGQWKFGGLQYLCTFSELNTAYLKHARIHRYDKAIDPNEESYENTSKVDQYAFAVLVDDVFKGHSDDDVPHLKEFRKYCRNCLQNSDPSKRPNLSEVLRDNFFNHEFISIYKFLNFLPFKSEDERCNFFSSILDNLKCFDEETVAKQLGGLLLSRLTLLDTTARRDVLPFILKPKNDRIQNGESSGFFHLSVFKEHVKPRLLQLFGVRDSQIRMLLLIHFTKFVHVFTHEELSQHILPELLLGIKDTDDELVASTLICLSELVPILGADTVVGGKRSRIFTDGRPKTQANLTNSNTRHINNKYKVLEDFYCTESAHHDNRNSDSYEQTITLKERPSPVGGESTEFDATVEDSQKITIIDSEEDWDDWENTNRQLVTVDLEHAEGHHMDETPVETDLPKTLSNIIIENDQSHKPTTRSTLLQKAALEAKKNILDISELDIKNQKIDVNKKKDDIDFFADMMPVIEKPKVITVNEELNFNKLDFVPAEADEAEDWGENWND